MQIRDVEPLSQIVGRADQDTPGKNDLFRSQSPYGGTSHETIRVEPDDGVGFPIIIMPAHGELDDFFASVATYYPDVSPISALVHVLSTETAKLLPPNFKAREKVALVASPAQRRMCIGAALGEAAAAAAVVGDGFVVPSYATCRRTLAFALARTRFLHGTKIAATSVAHRWAVLRELTGLPVSASSIAAVTITHHLAMDAPLPEDLANLDETLLKALRYESIRPDRLDPLGHLLADIYPINATDIERLSGPFDGRMTAFRNIISVIRPGPSTRWLDEIAVAYFCNRIQPGSFAHTGVLANLASIYPASLVWYGYFSAACSDLIPSNMDAGLLAKLERDLLKAFSFNNRPECDIALEELEVLSRIRLKPDAIRGSHARALLVALVPGVDVYTRFGVESDPQGDKSRIVGLMQSRDHARRLLEEALRVLGGQPGSNEQASEGSRTKGTTKRRRYPDQ